MIRHIWRFLLPGVLIAIPGQAQVRDAQVLFPGEVRLAAGGEYLGFRAEYDGGGWRPIAADLGGPLTPSTFAPLQDLSGALAAFLTATDSVPFPVTDADLFAGDLSTDISWNTRTVPIRLGIGIVSRVELGVGGSVYRTERFPRRVQVSGGNLGVNPDRTGNALKLGQVDPTGGELGSEPLLPLEGSALGAELQRRVFAATEDSLNLPESPLTGTGLRQAMGVDPFPYSLSAWRAGDVEFDARVEVLRSFEGTHLPAGGDFAYRATAVAGFRLGTGERGFDNPRLDWGPDVGHNALRLGGAVDLFVGRLWLSGGGSWGHVYPADVRVATSDEVVPGASTVVVVARRSPGDEADFWIMPRFRLIPEISFGASFHAERAGVGHDEIAGVETALPERSRRFVGFSVSYTNLPAYDAGTSDLPIEASLGYREAYTGSGGVPAARVAFFQVSILRRMWGE